MPCAPPSSAGSTSCSEFCPWAMSFLSGARPVVAGQRFFVCCTRIRRRLLEHEGLHGRPPASNPMTLEETFERLVLDAMNQHRHIFVEDLGLLSNVVGSCNSFYQRRGLLDAPLTTISTLVTQLDKKLIVGVVNSPSKAICPALPFRPHPRLRCRRLCLALPKLSWLRARQPY
jgi:hypothetical protein